MKKRLLSAALALAMVLTLLPLGVMSASAASAGDDAYYHVQGNAFANASENNSTDASSGTGWYARTRDTSVSGTKYTYEALSDGFVTSVATNNGATAKYYTAFGTYDINGKSTTVKPASFTVLGSSVTIDTLDWDITNAKLNGNTLAISGFSDRNQKIVVNGFDASWTKGTLTLPSTLTGRTLTLTATGVNVGGVTVQNNTGKTDGGGSITLTDCALNGDITMPKGTLTLTNTDGGTLSMGTSANGQGGTVNLDRGSDVTSVAMYGPSTLNIKDTSTAGNVTVFGGGKGDVPNNTKNVNPGWKGVTVNLSQSGSATGITHASTSNYSSESTDTTTHTIKAESRGDAGNIDLDYANVTLDGAGAGTVEVDAGSVKLSGSADATSITVGGKGKCTLEVGAGATVGAVTSTAAAADLTVRISGGTFSGAINLGSYAGGGITGGTFASAITNASWLGNVTYQIHRSSSYTYTNSFADAVSAYTDSSSNKIAIVGADDTSDKSIAFQLEDGTEVFKLYAKANTLVPLPTVIGKHVVSKWYSGSIPLTAGELYPMGSADVTLKATSTEADLGTINGVSAKVNGGTVSPNLDAKLVGNTIKLSGAVEMGSNNYAVIDLQFTTTTSGANDSNLQVSATFYDGNPKTVRFTGTPGTGLEVSNDYKEVGLKGSNTKFTVDCSGLVRLQSVTADTNAATQAVSVSGTNLGPTEKANLINALKATTFDYTSSGTESPALQQAINKALASYTSSGVDSAIATGRREAAKQLFGVSSPNKDQLADSRVTAYNTLKLQVYLDIQVTGVTNFGGANGSLTLNITPKYHEMVYSGSTAAPNPVSKALDSALLKSTDGKVTITLPVGSLTTIFGSNPTLYAHHGEYVYPLTAGAFENLHGFSTFVINAVEPVASVDTIVRNGVTEGTAGTPAYYYDSLAAAVADVAKGGTVTVAAGYKGPTSIPVSGSARQFTVNNSANAGTALTFTGANVTSNGANDTYTVELTRDTVGGTTKLTVNTVPNGSASLSAANAVPGATVTGTIRPNTGYMAGSFTATAQTTTGGSVNVSVKVDAANNTFSFVVPNNAVSVVVTPVFVVGDGRVVIGVASAVGGSATTSAAATENKAAPGATVTVATVPNNGYRTIGLTARTNTGATVAVTRTGLNAFSMVIPTGAVTVTVTPSFDLDTGTPFADVLSSHWATKYVTWAYQTKYVEGTGTYAFSPATYITRGEVVAMLWKAEGKPIVNYANPFKDVPTNYWAYDAVMWAASKGLIDTSSSYFMPTGYASRAEVVTILYKRANSPTVYGTSGFADVPASAAYSRAVTWARQNKLTNGYGGNTYFRPNYAISRAEVATFLARAFGNIA